MRLYGDVAWSDTFTRHPVHREAIVDHFRVVKVARAWDDGEELDPVDRIVVEAEICGMMATDGIETVPPDALAAKQGLAEARADGSAPPYDEANQDPVRSTWRKAQTGRLTPS